MWTQTLGEFIGTFILVLLGDGVVAGVSLNKSKANGAGWIAITLGWGLAAMRPTSYPNSSARLS